MVREVVILLPNHVVMKGICNLSGTLGSRKTNFWIRNMSRHLKVVHPSLIIVGVIKDWLNVTRDVGLFVTFYQIYVGR